MQQAPKSPDKLYGTAFHADRDARTRAVAKTILSHLMDWTEIDSVCDVGCGVGTWLAAAGELGVKTVLGFEGPWGESADLVVDRSLVRFSNLQAAIRTELRYDLVVSLEVAEHLTEDRAPGFVADLCALGDLVLFSAAIPNQGGTGHVNERWQSYWAELFAGNGYCALDAVRPLIWGDDNIAWWYRQNILLYVREGSPIAAKLAAAGLQAPTYLDLVHPACFSVVQDRQPLRRLKKKVHKLLGGNR